MLDSLTLLHGQRQTLQAAAELYAKNVDLAANFLHARGLSREAAVSSLLGVCVEPAIPEHARFVGRLSVPFCTPAGVVALKFRCLEDHSCKEAGHPKYDGLATPTRLYNVAALRSPGWRVGVTEGELDALAATHILGLPSVGVPGIKNWKPWFSRCFADYSEVLVFADNDEDEEKGLKHAKRVIKEIEGARLVLPPPGKDLTEWLVEDGVEAVRNAIGIN